MKKMKVIDLFGIKYDQMEDKINGILATLQNEGAKIIDVKILNQVKKIYLGEVLEKHNISLSMLENTLAFYRREPELYFNIYEKIMIQISSEEALLNGDREEVKR